MEGITKIVGIIIAILLLLVAGYYGRGYIERGVNMAQGILGDTGDTAKQTLSNMNQDIILSMTKFTVTIKDSDDKIIDSATIMGYSALQGYLQEYNIDITSLESTDGSTLLPDTIISLYEKKCGGSGDVEDTEGADFGETPTFTYDGTEYTVTVIVSLPECES